MQLVQIGMNRFIRPRALAMGLACFLIGVGIMALYDCGNIADSSDAPTVWRDGGGR